MTKILRMVEGGTPCSDVLIQVGTVRSALNSVGQIILYDILRSCMVKAIQDREFEGAMQGLKNSLDRFIG